MTDLIYGDDSGQRQRDQLGDIFTLGLGDFRGQAARNAAANQVAGVEAPSYDLNASYVAPEYSGNFNPALYATPEAARYQTAQDSAEGRAAQLEALRTMGQQSNQAIGSQQDLDRLQAMTGASQLAQGREGAIRQDAARRGQIGGAADMIMRAQAAQDAANRNQEGGLQAAQQAALGRLAGTQAQAGLAGQLRGQDQGMSMHNADIINQFNLANTAARNAAAMGNVNTRNSAGLRNLDAIQQMNNARADAANNSLNRRDTLTTQNYTNQMGRASGIANALNNVGSGTDRQNQNMQNALQMFMRFYGGAAGSGAR